MTATLSKQTGQELFQKMEANNTSHQDNLDHLENDFDARKRGSLQETFEDKPV